MLNGINEAYENKQLLNRRSRSYVGTTWDGLKIKMYVNTEGKISTAFPLKEDGGN
ncbi:hypothetical protein ACQKJC_19135 [Priestia koreensis]|uniref:hypothetical protein n=1 Tax=Priestia koreensis TaxID=284581 RepID=UPI003D00F0BE